MSKDFQDSLSRCQRFSRNQRLTRGSEFKRVFATGIRASDEYFIVLGQNNPGNKTRLGLAIARRHIKTAVARNRIKRLVRESFRQNQDILPKVDLVVTLRRDVTGLTNQDIFRRLEKHWQTIKRLCDAS